MERLDFPLLGLAKAVTGLLRPSELEVPVSVVENEIYARGVNFFREQRSTFNWEQHTGSMLGTARFLAKNPDLDAGNATEIRFSARNRDGAEYTLVYGQIGEAAVWDSITSDSLAGADVTITYRGVHFPYYPGDSGGRPEEAVGTVTYFLSLVREDSDEGNLRPSHLADGYAQVEQRIQFRCENQNGDVLLEGYGGTDNKIVGLGTGVVSFRESLPMFTEVIAGRTIHSTMGTPPSEVGQVIYNDMIVYFDLPIGLIPQSEEVKIA